MLFETKHSLDQKEFYLDFGTELSFPVLHIHRSFEFFVQLKGKTEVTVENQKYLLAEGQAVLIMPFQAHSYIPVEKGRYAISIFSPNLVPDYYKKVETASPENALMSYKMHHLTLKDNIYLQKAFVYDVCGRFDDNRIYRERTSKLGDDFLTKLLLFAESNYKSLCSLKNAASATGYDYAYVSKFFKKKVGISFKQYITVLRINEAQHLLRSSQRTVSQIKDECGFQTLRTFDRDFISVVGVSPSEYRKQMK